MQRILGLLLSFALLAPAAPPDKRGARLRIPVWVNSTAGETHLTNKDFTARLEGSPAEIVRARGPADDLLLVMILDFTQELALVDVAKESLIMTLRELPSNAHVAVMRAQDGLQVLLDPTTDRDQLAQTIRAVPVSGKAGLLDSLESATRVTESVLAKAAVRVALLYVTDSSIHNYRDDYTNPVINQSDHADMSRRFPEGLIKERISRLERSLSGVQTPLFIVHLIYRNGRLDEAYQSGLMQLSSALGGTSVFCRSIQEISGAVSGTIGRITSSYAVDIELPERHAKTLQVQLESGDRSLVYRTRFVVEDK